MIQFIKSNLLQFLEIKKLRPLKKTSKLLESTSSCWRHWHWHAFPWQWQISTYSAYSTWKVLDRISKLNLFERTCEALHETCKSFCRHDFLNSISLDSRRSLLNCCLIKSPPLIPSFFSVIDCLLSEWGPWSECDAKCGTGTRSRTRSILRAPENGGKHCASLTQKQGCEGYRCKSLHERKALSGKYYQRSCWDCSWQLDLLPRQEFRFHLPNFSRWLDWLTFALLINFISILIETAMLLPSELSKSRRENDTTDIRRNLKLRYSDLYKHNRDHEWVLISILSAESGSERAAELFGFDWSWEVSALKLFNWIVQAFVRFHFGSTMSIACGHVDESILETFLRSVT